MRNDRISRWAGWGRSENALTLKERPGLLAYLRQRLGDFGEPIAPTPLEQVAAGPTRLSEDDLTAIRNAVGAPQVDTSGPERVIHSLGKSYRDMLAARAGQLTGVTDAVVFPRSEDDIVALLQVARKRDLAVVPMGGGTSVVGGVEPRTGKHHAVITLDLMHLDAIELDTDSHLADIGAGAFGPAIEETLLRRGFTLGHVPQSFEFSTLGGWLATRGAGQQSTRYGKIEEIVQAVRLVTPMGTVSTRRVPASAAGPNLVQLIAGSEGTLGVITAATARIHPLPPCTRFSGYLLPNWPTGVGFIREILQTGIRPSVVRLSDAEETRWMMKAGAERKGLLHAVGRHAIRAMMRWRGFDAEQVCLCLLSLEGSIDSVALEMERVSQYADRHEALRLGQSPGRSWLRDRFRLPYLRDDLMARGLLVDTLETATIWSNIENLYGAVSHAIRSTLTAGGCPGAVMAHLSHAYPTGASLYFTFVARLPSGEELNRWIAVKQAVGEALVRCGGTLSHHHGIGCEHLPLSAENGATAVDALRALKASLDPEGLMNPGKLLEDRT